MRRASIALALVLFALAAEAAPADEILVFAAASLTDALDEIAPGYAATSGNAVRFDFGATSTLARQIEAGAPADLCLSADAATIDGLERRGLLLAGTRRRILSNRLAIIVAAEHGAAVAAPRDLLGPRVRGLALAEPESVPAGVYARQWLTALGLWDAVRAKVLPVDNVRAALATVAAGNADAAIVYRTDARISSRVRIAYAVPDGEGPPIDYVGAVVAATRHAPAARDFLRHLTSPPAQSVFQRHGFLPPRAEPAATP